MINVLLPDYFTLMSVCLFDGTLTRHYSFARGVKIFFPNGFTIFLHHIRLMRKIYTQTASLVVIFFSFSLRQSPDQTVSHFICSGFAS